MPAFTHIIGKTSDDHLTSMSMRAHSALAGKPKRIQRPTRTAASLSTGVAPATDGRNLSIIHKATRRWSAVLPKMKFVRRVTVLTITMRRSEESRLI